MIFFLSSFTPVEGMNYVIEIFLSLTICWWRVWRESEIVSTFMHFKVEEVWVCTVYITLKKVENCMTYHSLSSGKFNSPFKTFPDALTNCHCCKVYFKEGHTSKLKINHHIWIMPGHFFTKNSLHFFVVNLNLLWSIDHWILIILNFDAIHPKCAFVIF